MLCVIFCDVCYSVLCVIVVPLPPDINPLAVINYIYIYIITSRSVHNEAAYLNTYSLLRRVQTDSHKEADGVNSLPFPVT